MKKSSVDTDFVLDNNKYYYDNTKVDTKNPTWFTTIVLFSILIIISYFTLSIFNYRDNSLARYLGTTKIDKRVFIDKISKYNLELNISNSIVTAKNNELSYEIIYCSFNNNSKASDYYNRLIEYADESKSSYSYENTNSISKKRILVSNKMNGLMIISNIENTIVTGIAYNTNNYGTVVEILKDLGY